MTMGPRLRKLALTAHVTASVGTLGAVAAFLALAVTGLASAHAETVRAAYVAMDAITWFVIVPAVAASLLTGLIQSLGTPWGLFRHYWVLIKFLLTILVVAVLLLQTRPIGYLAQLARRDALPGDALFEARMSLAAHAGGGLLVLVVAAALSVYKPPGLTSHGLRKQRQRQEARADRGRPAGGGYGIGR